MPRTITRQPPHSPARPPEPQATPDSPATGDTPEQAPQALPTRDNPAGWLPPATDPVDGPIDAQPRPVIEQAKRDLDAGQVDTDLRGTPGLDAERRARLLSPRRRH